MIKVSVVIPTHNRPELLKKAVSSVLNQTYKDFELIIIDVGLERRSDNIVSEFNDSSIIYIKSEKELNGSAARNIGIKQAKGDFIAFLDDDDEWVSEKLEIQMKEFADTSRDVGFCFSAVTNVFGKEQKDTKVPSGVEDYLEAVLIRTKTFLNVTLIVKKYVFDDIGVFDESLPSHQEADLIIRITKKYKGLGVNRPLVRVNMLADHDSVGKSIKKGIVGKEIILSKHWEDFKNKSDILARKYFELGLLYRNSSQFIKAKDMFEKAMNNNFSLLHLSHYFSMMFGGAIYKLIRSRKLPKMKLVAIMHVKNGMKTIENCLDKLSTLVDEIIMVDNGSTDGTLEIFKNYPKIVKLLHTEGYHGGRDVRLLLEEAKKRYPDWILLIDADEVFEKHLTRKIVEKYMHSGHDRVQFRMFNFWLSKKYFRIDRDWFLYTLRPQRQMFRNLEGIYFQDIKVHYGPIQGINPKAYTSPFRIKHYGYVEKEEVDRKIQMYATVDEGERNYYSFHTPIKDVIRHPFLEFDNGRLNYLYVLLYKLVADILVVCVLFKRKHFRRLKFFSK